MIQELPKDWSQSIERYESKFTIPFALVEPISDFLSIYCRLDTYSERSPDGFYRVNSLYLDSPRLHFLRKRLDVCDNRFNLRIRSYGEKPEPPYFLEIKQKKVNVVRKYRAAVTGEDWPQCFESTAWSESEEGNGRTNRTLFLKLVHTYDAAPKVLTQYWRKAYVSEIDKYARATFDVALRYHPEEEYTVHPQEETMIPLDNVTLFDPGCDTILELKCNTKQVPLWMIDLVRHFDLRRRSFSKYVISVTEALCLFHYDRTGWANVSNTLGVDWSL